jgi:hypothetical protein
MRLISTNKKFLYLYSFLSTIFFSLESIRVELSGINVKIYMLLFISWIPFFLIKRKVYYPKEILLLILWWL